MWQDFLYTCSRQHQAQAVACSFKQLLAAATTRAFLGLFSDHDNIFEIDFMRYVDSEICANHWEVNKTFTFPDTGRSVTQQQPVSLYNPDQNMLMGKQLCHVD